MLRALCSIALVLTLLPAQPAALLAADKDPPESGESKPPVVELLVELVDVGGRPVAGAEVGLKALLGDIPEVQDRAAKDGTEWWYPRYHTRSDVRGMARIGDDDEYLDLLCVVVRHERRKIMAIANVDPKKLDKPLRLTLRPECIVSGRVTCPELAAQGDITWGVVNVSLGDKSAVLNVLNSPSVILPLPPGEYEFKIRAADSHELKKTIRIDGAASSLDLGTIEVRATNLALLTGKLAPELPDVVAWKNGPATTLGELRGRVVLLDFWGYWCGPCVGQMPKVFALYDKYHEQGLEVVGVHIDLGENETESVDTAAKLDARLTATRQELWNGRDIPFPVALLRSDRTPYRDGVEAQARSSSAATYGILMYPTQVLIDRQGRVLGEFYHNEEGSKQLERALQER